MPKTRPKAGSSRQLGSLLPSEFENLMFDLLINSGLSNVAWRTPGADGGRDIEGYSRARDLSGYELILRWFVECKRYARAVDWPTIYGKLAYADALRADVLLMCTTGTFSPNAVSQSDQWNADRRKPVIRLWPRHEIAAQLTRYPDLVLKYGLSGSSALPGRSLLAISLALSKTVSSHYSRQVFEGQQIDRMIQAGQALADLIQHRLEDGKDGGPLSARICHRTPSIQS